MQRLTPPSLPLNRYDGSLSYIAFQLTVLATRYAEVSRALRKPGLKMAICERSMFSDKQIFAAERFASDPKQKAAYETAFDALIGSLPRNLRTATVLLDAPVDVVAKRVKTRSRSAECTDDAANDDGTEKETGVSTEFLASLDRAHDAYYKTLEGPKARICAGGAPGDVKRLVLEAIEGFKAETLPPPPARSLASSPSGVSELPLSSGTPTKPARGGLEDVTNSFEALHH